MNGSNSNTKGSEVANIGFWPRAILPSVVVFLGNTIKSLKGLQVGQVIPIGVDFSEQGASDHLTDEVMAEITRRLIVTLESEKPGQVLFQPTEPADHTKGWWQTDPITNLPISGKLKVWKDETQKWEDVDTSNVYIPPLRRTGKMVSPAGASVQNLNFVDMKTSDYIVTLTPTTYNVTSNSWAPAPGSFPSGFGFVLSNKTNTSISVSFNGIPTGGLTWEVDVQERKDS